MRALDLPFVSAGDSQLYDGFVIEIELGLQEDVFEACRTHDGKRLEAALMALRDSLGTTP
jgi:hypothetical protein